MPFGKCPVCGASYHLSIGMPVVEWYQRHWPGVTVGDPVPGKCARCWVELRPGHRVSVRSVPPGLEGQVEVGAQGIVTFVEPSDPPIVVALEGAAVRSGRFNRTELFYVLGQKADASQGAVLDDSP
jgi:hypothetical protein